VRCDPDQKPYNKKRKSGDKQNQKNGSQTFGLGRNEILVRIELAFREKATARNPAPEKARNGRKSAFSSVAYTC
jgi:hypothetical protein